MQNYIYILKTGDCYFKVGVTNHIEGRLANLQTGCPTEISIIKTYPVDFPFETELTIQEFLKNLPRRGEWYQFYGNEKDFVNKVDQGVLAVEKKVKHAKHADFVNKYSEMFATVLHDEGKSPPTIDAYVFWAEKLSKFASKEMNLLIPQDAIKYLSHIHETMSFNTYKQASYAISHYYNTVLNIPLGDAQFASKNPSERIFQLPEYVSRSVAIQIIEAFSGNIKLIAALIYGSGIRLTECLRLRARDVDLDNRKILLRTSRKAVARKTFIPLAIFDEFKIHLEKEQKRYAKSSSVRLTSTVGLNPIPPIEELESWDYQFVFTSRKAQFDRNLNKLTTTHLDPGTFQKMLRKMSSKLSLEKVLTASILRHSFAVHMLQKGVDIESLRKLLGHRDIKNTKIYLELIDKPRVIPESPLDW